VAHGVDGLDEISILGPTQVAEVKDGRIEKYEIAPEDFGFERASFKDVQGGDPAFNAAAIIDVFEGRDQGPRRDFLVLNNGFALYVGGVASSPEEGMKLAQETLDSGRAAEKLTEFAAASHRISPVD